MNFPLVTKNLVQRLSQCDPNYRDDRMRTLQALPGNPAGIEFHHFDHVQATISKHGWFDTIRGLDIGDEDRFDAAMALYRERGVKLRLGLTAIPGFFDEPLAQRFLAHGFIPTGFHTILYGLPQPISRQPKLAPVASDVTVEPVNKENIGLFVTALCAGFEMQLDSPSGQTAPAWLDLPGWHLYLARAGGVPAAAAILHVREGVGSLAAGATVPAFRRRGCQTALIQARLADAHALSCDLVRGAGAFESVSQHNQERAGLRVAYTCALWKEAEGG